MLYNRIMKIALLGHGKEGKSAENYFKSHFPDATFDIFEDFTHDDIIQQDFSSYDYVSAVLAFNP